MANKKIYNNLTLWMHMEMEKDMREEKQHQSIFLSYTHKDKTFAKRLAQDLGDFGIKVWIDEAEIKVGDSLLSKIKEGIDNVDYLGVILSPNSIDSPWVQKEVEIAMTQEIEGKLVKVLPLLYKKCDLPSFLKGKMYADFTKEEDYIKNLKKILERMGITSFIQDEEIYLRSVRRTVIFLSKSGFFYTNSFLTLLSPLLILPKTGPYPYIPSLNEFYKIPNHLVKTIRELLIESFSNIWNARKLGSFGDPIEGSYVCIGNARLRRLRDSYIPLITFDKAKALSLYSSTLQSKLKKLRSSKKIERKESKAHYALRSLELDVLFGDLINLLSFIKGYNICIPIHSLHLGSALTWLLYNENEVFLAGLWSSYGDENEDEINFYLNRTNNKILMVYMMALGIHSAFGNSIDGLLYTLERILWIRESFKKDLEIWLVPSIRTISKEEISEIKGLQIEIKKEISKIDENIEFVFFDKDTLKYELIYSGLENFTSYVDTTFGLI